MILSSGRLLSKTSSSLPSFSLNLLRGGNPLRPCPAEHDDNYWFHMTVAIGRAPFENYRRAYEELSKMPLDTPLTFDKLGLLYYDDDSIAPGIYFCYKVAQLS